MYSRHDLVWLSAEGWRTAMAIADARHADTMSRWRDSAWPLIVTRQPPDAQAGTLALGLAAPSRVRIALTVHESDIARHGPPPPLGTLLSQAPAPWQAGLAELDRTSMDLRVFGSFALQAITGQQYLRENSDIDLLFSPRTRKDLQRGCERLASVASSLPLDGEIIFPGGAGVSWKEWQSVRDSDVKVLVKHRDRVALMAPAQLLAELAP